MSIFNKKNNKINQVFNPNLPVIESNPGKNEGMATFALKYISEGVVIVDNNAIIRMMNPNCAKMTGNLDGALAEGLDFELVFNFEDKDGQKISKENNLVLRALSAGVQYRTRDYVLVPKDSVNKIAVDICIIPANDQEGYKIITLRDITKELQDDEEQLDFISTASHEMRTPVASIEGYLGLALNTQTATIDDRARKYLESASQASKHLGKLFQDLLDVTKLDDNKVKPDFVPAELTEVAERVVSRYLGLFNEKKIQFSFGDKQGKILNHGVKQPLYVLIDLLFFDEIMSNLIENAVKFSPNGGTLSVKLYTDGNYAKVAVEDSGVGIPHEDIPHVFQKFYRVDNSATRQIGGTGLGLYIVKKRMESMNGDVTVESTYGKGSIFYLAFPRLSFEEYSKQKLIYDNEQKAKQVKEAQELAQVMNQLRTQTMNVENK